MKIEAPASPIPAMIDRWHEKHQSKGMRPHLGASLLGHPCDRWLWLSFRWAVAEQHSGRVLRLFRRGQREETVIIEDLRRIGVMVEDHPEQVRVDFGAHVSGSLDGIIASGEPEAPKKRHILEIKTHNAKSFKDIQNKGVQAAKPMHWSQMQVYMHGTGIDRALYVAVCKDDDSLYAERVRHDPKAAQAMVDRGRRITLAERMPEPLSADPTWYQCKFCAAHDFCHEIHMCRSINCRTCAHVTPLENSTWTCARWGGAEIPLEEQGEPRGCHVAHPDLVPWIWKGGTSDGICALYEINGIPHANGDPDVFGTPTRELLDIGPEGEKVLIPF